MTGQTDLLELLGEQAKADGMARAEEATDSWWASCCDQAIAAMALTGKEFQAFDLVLVLGLKEPDHPNAWGPRFAAAAKRGVIRPAGYAPSNRPTTARSAVRTWVGIAARRGVA